MYVDQGIIFCGGRDFRNRHLVGGTITDLITEFGDFICVQGGADGADQLVREFAIAAGIPCLNVPANWQRYGKSAGPRRNRQMLEICREPLVVVAFPGGRGTRNMVAQAEEWRVREVRRVGWDS